VERAEQWRWLSLWQRQFGDAGWLADWPVPRPRRWLAYVNGVETDAEMAALRRSVQRGRPYGQDAWIATTAADLGIESSLRPRGRPRKEPATG
jgi:putative transposase